MMVSHNNKNLWRWQCHRVSICTQRNKRAPLLSAHGSCGATKSHSIVNWFTDKCNFQWLFVNSFNCDGVNEFLFCCCCCCWPKWLLDLWQKYVKLYSLTWNFVIGVVRHHWLEAPSTGAIAICLTNLQASTTTTKTITTTIMATA